MSLQAAKEICGRGDAEFLAHCDAKVIQLYTHAFNSIKAAADEDGNIEMMLRLLSKRSRALMRQEDYLGALADVEAALAMAGPGRISAAVVAEMSDSACHPAPTTIDKVLVECHYQLALLLLLLQRPGEAIKAAASFSFSIPFKALIADAEVMWAEKHDGRYNLQEMEVEAKKVAADPEVISPSLSYRKHGDFESQSIRLEFHDGKGRGFMAASHIPEGDLIMASRAFVIVRSSENAMLHAIRGGAGQGAYADSGAQAYALPLVVRTLVDHPDRAPDLYSLNGGRGFEANSGETKRVDIQRIMGILSNK